MGAQAGMVTFSFMVTPMPTFFFFFSLGSSSSSLTSSILSSSPSAFSSLGTSSCSGA